jgi:endoglucanase
MNDRILPSQSARHALQLALACALCISASGCITSRTGAYLNADEAAAEKLGRCPDGLIEDLEDGDTQVNKTEGRNGYWFTFYDPAGSTISPSSKLLTDGGSTADSKMFAKASGKMATSGPSIYAGLGFNITDPKSPYDASKYRGIAFWAKGPGTVRFKTPDVNTEPGGDKCVDCYNDFGVDIYLSKDWTRYTIPFDKMKQQPGWGDPAPGVASDGLFAIQWQVGAKGADYEVSIDGVEFVGCN